MPHRSAEDQVEDGALLGEVCGYIENVLVLESENKNVRIGAANYTSMCIVIQVSSRN